MAAALQRLLYLLKWHNNVSGSKSIGLGVYGRLGEYFVVSELRWMVELVSW